MKQPLELKSSGKTDVGQVRSTNQDSFLIDESHQLYIVADGMGGHAGGEIASQVAIEEIQKYLKNHEESFQRNDDDHTKIISQHLAQAVNHASARIYERALEDPALKGMGTTATLIKMVGNRAFVAHVGDSRLYLIRSGYLYQITNDHSLVNEQVRAGIITEEEAKIHHLKNVITRSVGYQEEEDVDTTSFDISDKDLLVLCSDGLHGKVSDQEISKAINEKQLNSVEHLIDLANDRGGEDNITLVVIQVNEIQTQT